MNATERATVVEEIEETISDLETEAAAINEALTTARRLLSKLRQQLDALGDLDEEEDDEED